MKILITAGATREPIDAVRFISNLSTGGTGAALADEFSRCGFEVVLLHGEAAVRPHRAVETEKFSTAADLRARLERRLGAERIDAVIMAAAVSDYSPSAITMGKISSESSELALQLVRNEKILPRLKSFSPRPLRVVGFKLTAGANEAASRAAVAAQFAQGGVDAIVHNDLNEIRAAGVHPFRLWPTAIATPIRLEGVPPLAAALAEILATPLT